MSALAFIAGARTICHKATPAAVSSQVRWPSDVFAAASNKEPERVARDQKRIRRQPLRQMDTRRDAARRQQPGSVSGNGRRRQMHARQVRVDFAGSILADSSQRLASGSMQ